MDYSKPKVIIDLEEYEYLLSIAKTERFIADEIENKVSPYKKALGHYINAVEDQENKEFHWDRIHSELMENLKADNILLHYDDKSQLTDVTDLNTKFQQ